MKRESAPPGRKRQAERPLGCLLECVADGDREAFEELYRRTSAKLFGVCLRILPERREAEDALQTIYLAVWRHAARFEASRGAPMTWLITLARNRAIDRLRATRAFTGAPIEAADELADPGPIASDTIEAADEARRLRDCLGRLDRRDSGLIRAAFFEGSTYTELADRDGTPLGTVKSRIRRALLKLRDCLG